MVVQQALRGGLAAIVSPRRTIAATEFSTMTWFTLIGASLLAEIAPFILAEIGGRGEFPVLWSTYGLWTIPGVTAFLAAMVLLYAFVIAYFGAFNFAVFRFVSSKVGYRKVITAGAFAVFISAAVSFPPALAVLIAGLVFSFPTELPLSVIDKLAMFAGAIYIIVMLAEIAGIGGGRSFLLNLAASLCAIVVGLALAWAIGRLFPNLDKLLWGGL